MPTNIEMEYPPTKIEKDATLMANITPGAMVFSPPRISDAYVIHIVLPTQEKFNELETMDADHKAEICVDVDGALYKFRRADLVSWLEKKDGYMEVTDFSTVPVHEQLYIKARHGYT